MILSPTAKTISDISNAITGRVAKAGDTMTGTLNLPTNGLIVGTNQLIVSGGNVGIGTTGPSSKLYILADTTYSGNEVAMHGINIGTGGTPSSDNYLYMGADKTNNLSYIQSVGRQALQALVLQGRGDNVGIGIIPLGILQVKQASNIDLLIQGPVAQSISINAVNDANTANIPLEIRSSLTAGNITVAGSVGISKHLLNAGTYTFKIVTQKSSSKGIMELLHGNTSIGTADQYAGTSTPNVVNTFSYSPTARSVRS